MTDALKLSYGVMKRSFTVAVVIATILWSVAATFAVAPRAAHAATSGDLVKGSLSAVYYVGSDSKRYVFPNDKVYFTWYTDFSTVKKISDTDLAALTIGGNVTYKPGVKMVKIQSDPKVYAVGHGGVLRPIASEAAASALYGSTWNKKIDDISDAFFVNYTVGSQISSASDFVIATEQANSTSINTDKGLSGAGALNISLASDNPAGSTLTCNASGVNFLKVNLSGTGTVTGLTFHRIGAGVAADFSNVYLYDGDTRLTVGRSVTSSDNSVTFSNLNVAVSGSKELTLVADLAALTASTATPPSACVALAGDSNAFAINAATDVVTNTTVGGTFPIAGGYFSIAASKSGTLAVTPGSAPSNPKVGQQAAELASFKVQAGSSEDVILRRIIVTNAGSAQLANLANLKITDAGTIIAQNPIISGTTATFVLAVPYTLGKGIQRTLSLVGDVLAANRAGVDTIKFYIDQTYDVYATGSTYGMGVNVTNTFTTGNSLSIDGGQITYAFNGPTTGNISVGANDANLLKFAITSQNNIEVKSTTVRLTFSADVSADIANVTDIKIKNADTGVVVAGPFDLSSWTGYTDATFVTVDATPSQWYAKTFTDRYDVSSGKTVNYVVSADILTTGTGLAAKSVTATLAARVGTNIRNMDSNLDVATTDIVPASALAGNPQTVSASGLTVGLASSPSTATVTKGSTVNAVGINFTAGSASDVKVSQVKLYAYINLINGDEVLGVSDVDSTSATHYSADLVQSVSIWDGTTQLGTTQSPSAGLLTFSNLAWTIPAGTTKTLVAKVTSSNNAPYGAQTNHIVIDLVGTGDDNTTSDIAATDKDTNTVSATSTAWSSTQSHLNTTAANDTAWGTNGAPAVYDDIVASGSLTMSLDGDTPVTSIVTANTNDNSVTRVKFNSVNEAFLVTRLTVENVGSIASSRSITSVRVYDKDGTLVCSGALDSANRLRCANDAGLFTVNGNHTVTIKTNLAQEGSGTTGANSGDKPKMAVVVPQADDAADVYTDDIKVVGVSSGTALVDTDVGGGSLTVSDNLLATKITVATTDISGGSFVVGDTVTQGSATGRIVSVTVVSTNTVITVVDTAGAAFTASGTDLVSTSSPVATAATVGAVDTTVVLVGAQGNSSVIRKTQPTVATVATSTNLINGEQTVYQFSVTSSSNADVAIHQFNLNMSRYSVAVNSYRVFENGAPIDASLYRVCSGTSTAAPVFVAGVMTTCSTEVSGSNIDLTTVAGIATGDTTKIISVVFGTERTIAAGTTKTYAIKATVSGAISGDSLSHVMSDDATETSISGANTGNLVNVVAAAAPNFVWSDTSADSHNTGTAATFASSSTDWTNGYLVKTLPTSSQTLSL